MATQAYIPASTPASRIPAALRLAERCVLLLAAILFALHFVHLTADFPNHSRWDDWSKYTDEGWYGDAAIRHFQWGHWNVPGDFNPAAALPLWPLLEAAVFHFTGVSLLAARILTVLVFGGILAASYALLARWQPTTLGRPSLAPALATLLLAASPFCFVFTRMAILEPLLVLLTLLALLAASAIPAAVLRGRAGLPIATLGVLLPAIILTKTTGVFLLPAIAFLLWAAGGYRARPFLRAAIPVLALAAAIWGTYFFLLVRPHFLEDYRYLFSANGYTGINPDNALDVIHDTFHKAVQWMGLRLYIAAMFAAVVALVRLPHLRRQPLIPTLLLWIAGYLAFLAYHNNLQPRYYLVVVIPAILLVAAVLEPAFAHLRQSPTRPVLAIAAAAVYFILFIPDAAETIHYTRTPDYTLIQAARAIAGVIRADPKQNPLLLSISGSDISLITGVRSICDDFGTLDLGDRVRRYRPGWYAAWNQLDDDKMDSLTPLFHPVRVAAFPAMDSNDRNLLILYRLDPATSATTRRRPRPIPKPLQSKIGQQPSVEQLEH